MTTTSVLPDVGIELREGYAAVGGGDVNLHYVEAGDGPLVVLLHGFPEFWFGWRLQIAPLVAAGFRVVAPDTRGYNLSSKPEDFESYGVDLLAADIRGLIGELGAESARLVGHDWGGSIAWTVAMNHPEIVDQLAILNAAHPRRLSEGLRHPSQLRKSWYFFFFAVPGLPEDVVHASPLASTTSCNHACRERRPENPPQRAARSGAANQTRTPGSRAAERPTVRTTRSRVPSPRAGAQEIASAGVCCCRGRAQNSSRLSRRSSHQCRGV
jgi:pimeloyl-ACP methyl ester carboxylesterase